jgi:hypothetical protein
MIRIVHVCTLCIQHCFICRPSDSTVSEDAGIETRTVATLALTRSSRVVDEIRIVTPGQSANFLNHEMSRAFGNWDKKTEYENLQDV